MNRPAVWHSLLVAIVAVLLVLAAIPVVASDLFREPYSPAWTVINNTLARLHYSYNPPGGGAPPQFPAWRDPADAGLYYRDVVLYTEDNVRLTGWFVPAVVTPAPTVLLAHGLYDSKWTMLRLVPWLHEAGYNAMLFDFRGHGSSEHVPTTIGRLEALDVKAALDWLQSQGAAEWVAGLGMSLGAASLVNEASQDLRIRALVLDSCFAEWKNVDYARGYRLPPQWLVPDVPDPVKVIQKLHVPVFIIHGTADNLVRVYHAYELFDAANDPKDLWINDSGHAWSAWTYPLLYQEKVLTFLRGAHSP